MGLGYNYCAPNYREVNFDANDLESSERLFGKIVPVPKNHKIEWQGDYQATLDRLGESQFRNIVSSAPSGIEEMVITEL